MKYCSIDESNICTNSNPIIQMNLIFSLMGFLQYQFCLKDLGLIKLKEEHLQDEKFLITYPLYLAPSGIRMNILTDNDLSSSNSSSSKKSPKLWAPPPNADILLNILKISHRITLKEKNQLKWVAVITNINHLNGNTPSIANYNKLSSDNEGRIIWPLDLCFVQIHKNKNNTHNNNTDNGEIFNINATNNDIKLNYNDNIIQFNSLNDIMNTIDDFIQIRQTAAMKTPGGSSALNTYPLSSRGGYTEQFQQYYKNTGVAMFQHSFSDKVSPLNSYSTMSP